MTIEPQDGRRIAELLALLAGETYFEPRVRRDAHRLGTKLKAQIGRARRLPPEPPCAA